MNNGLVIYNEDTSEVLVRKKTGNRIRTPFSVVGLISNVGLKVMKEDVFDLLNKVSKKAFSVFNNLKYNRSLMNNVCRYTTIEEMDKTEKETLSRNITELKKAGLIRVFKNKFIQDRNDTNKKHYFIDFRKTYIINPEMIRCNNHDEAEYLWEQCGGVNSDKDD